MEWDAPQFLYLILPLCCAWLLLALYSERKRQRAREAFVAKPMWVQVLPATSQSRFWLKLFLRELALATGLVALAGPKFGTVLEPVVPRGSDLYVLMDVSRSMLADDVSPSRLERAKSDVSALINRLDGERVGLIAFAGQAVVKCPLTVDYDSFRRSLQELDPGSAPRGGTAIGDAIRKAIEVFDRESQRDQAVLLITDGDDQESYPLEAATVAAEKKVTVFTVGLGDTEKGSRVPVNGTASFVEHEGQQVWSKLNGTLLQEIALKTSGVYIPAGTRAYDLGELYTSHLHGRKGDEADSQQRVRKSERFQIFLAIALLALLLDLSVSLYPATNATVPKHDSRNNMKGKSKSLSTITATTMSILCFWISSLPVVAGEEHKRLRTGIKYFEQDKFEEARKEFSAAGAELEKVKSEKVAVAAFDEGCAYHRQGEHEKAKDCYLKAGLSRDRSVALASHFNLGTMSAEKGRKLAGDQPEDVPPKEREAILIELKQAIASYRHCIELNPDHLPSRRNLELLRNWIKYYGDRWRERDRQKLRDESNLLEFLEFVIKTQGSLQSSVKQFPKNVAGDAFAELKRMQTELREELPTLQGKIAKELIPPDLQQNNAAQAIPEEIQEGIKLLQSWANAADKKMDAASKELGKSDANATIVEQQAALDELDKIWDAVIPFRPLLIKELAEQTGIVKSLLPESTPALEDKSNNIEPIENELAKNTDGRSKVEDPKNEKETIEKPSEDETDRSQAIPKAASKLIVLTDEQAKQLAEQQAKVLQKAKLLSPKAEAELEREEKRPPPTDADSPSTDAASSSVDSKSNPTNAKDSTTPESDDSDKLKAGLKKAIELAPKAVDAMEEALKSLKKRDNFTAGSHAEEARRILDEILKAQPKNEQDKNNQQDQKNEKQEDDKNQSQSESKQDQQKQDDQQKEPESKEENKTQDKQEEKKDEQSNEAKQPKPQQIAQDKMEEALRKVRERQEEKRDRDREMRMRMIVPGKVDKDW